MYCSNHVWFHNLDLLLIPEEVNKINFPPPPHLNWTLALPKLAQKSRNRETEDITP